MTNSRQTVFRVGAVIVCVAALIGGVTAASARPSHQAARGGSDVQVFTVVERATTDVVVYVNKKAQDDVIGNTLGFGNKLYNAKNTKKIGRDQGFCYRTNPGKFWECTWTNILKDGRIVVQGVFPDSLNDSKLAITGGTGAYKDAEGFMILHSRNAAGTAFNFEFHVR
ncbi:MAG TPA: dirigent protein [Actinomycetes bacterium]|nr:dirigent protein [Actinomycetes bacterium]